MLITTLLTHQTASQFWTCSRAQINRSAPFLTPLFFGLRHRTGYTSSSDEKHVTQTHMTLKTEDFLSIAPMVLLRQALQRHSATKCSATEGGGDVISRKIFNQYCSESHVADTNRALMLLEESGFAVSISNGKAVHLRPVQLLLMYEDVNNKKDGMVNDFSSFFLQEAERRLKATQADEIAMRRALHLALRRAAKWRRFLWSAALCIVGAHLAITSRLTFVDLDWDIMEPITYFLGSFISLMFFLYFLRSGRSCTYAEYDKTILPALVKRYAPRDFDWEKYEAVCRRVETEKQMLDRFKDWLGRH